MRYRIIIPPSWVRKDGVGALGVPVFPAWEPLQLVGVTS